MYWIVPSNKTRALYKCLCQDRTYVNFWHRFVIVVIFC